MARERMVTRAIIGTEVTALCFFGAENTCKEVTTLLAGVYKNEDKLAKKLKSVLDDSEKTFVKVVTSTEKSTLYGMTEDDFINNAVVLDPETRRRLETEVEATETEAE